MIADMVLGCACALLGVVLLVASAECITLKEPAVVRIICIAFLWLLSVTWLMLADEFFHDVRRRWRG